MKATWILPNGQSITAEVAAGQTLMEAARANNIPQILGDCGGNLSCATCHVSLDPAWFAKTGTPGPLEDPMLDITDADRTSTSRLSCQLTMSEALDGIILHIPK
jgi:ferredoxin, 2Fe-2S